MLSLRPALTHARRFLSLRLVLVVAVVLTCMTLGRPVAGPERAAAMPHAQIPPPGLTWGFGTTGNNPFFSVSGVQPQAAVGSTQTWLLQLPAGTGIAFRASGPTLSGSAPYCQVQPGTSVDCVNSGTTTASAFLQVTLPLTPGVSQVEAQGGNLNGTSGVQANLFLVATPAAAPQCAGASNALTTLQSDAGGRC